MSLFTEFLNVKKASVRSRKRIFLLTLYCSAIALYFWTQSRYPGLNLKAIMGERAGTSGIVFDVFYATFSDDSWLARVAKSTINWYYTNWKGMTFSILFAGPLFSLLRKIDFLGFRSPWLNAFLGMSFGAPLGVCANCSTPISAALKEGGHRLETSLAALISSPTLNPVVLTMAFTLLPAPLGLFKVLGTIFLILGIIPLLGRLTGASSPVPAGSFFLSAKVAPPWVVESWPRAVLGTLGDILVGTSRLIVLTIPLMLLAGLLGSIVIELVPMEVVASMPVTLLGAIAYALIGTFLPVPMTFDVIMVAILIEAGLHPTYAMILLFTLGAFSVYPFMVLWKTVSLKLSVGLLASVMFIGMGSGLLVEIKNRRDLSSSKLALDQLGLSAGIGKELIESKVRQGCLSLPPPFDEGCVGRVATKFASWQICDVLPEGRKSLCHEMLRVERMKGSCNPKVRSDCKPEEIESGPNTSVEACGAEKEAHNQHSCIIDVVALYKTNLFTLYAGCSHLKSPLLRDYCRVASLSFDPELSGDNLCESKKLAPTSRKFCLSNIGAIQAQISSKPDLCGENLGCREIATASEIVWSLSNIFLPSADSMELSAKAAMAARAKHSSPTKAAPLPESVEKSIAGLKVTQRKHFDRKPDGSLAFAKKEGVDFGINLPISRIDSDLRAFWNGRGVAAGDLDRDGWQDLVFSTDSGLRIYRNLGDLKFEEMPVTIKGQVGGGDNIMMSFLVDIDNDGFLDIYVASGGGENYFLLNNTGSFRDAQKLILPNQYSRLLSPAVGFNDLDRDGFLDIFMGNMGHPRFPYRFAEGKNEIYLNKNLKWVRAPYEDSIGALTHASLFSDVNDDGHADLFVSNASAPSDEILFGLGGGKFRKSTRQDGIFPSTPVFTMSYDSADINNDLKLDIFSTDSDGIPSQDGKSYCDFIISPKDRDLCKAKLPIAPRQGDTLFNRLKSCEEEIDLKERSSCLSHWILIWSDRLSSIELCDRIPLSNADRRRLCRLNFESTPLPASDSMDDIPQRLGQNLLVQGADGRFRESSSILGITKKMWGWDGRFADLDSDGWQDLYIATGHRHGLHYSTNFLYMNSEGKGFREATKEAGIQEAAVTSSFVYVDLRNQGTLDIVSNAVGAPPRFYLNNSKNNSVTFSLRDTQGNRDGVGAKMTIQYGAGKKQLREVKASGGYLSSSPYVLHFGLGAVASVDEVEIAWPDGKKTKLKEKLLAGYHYEIQR